MMKKRLSVLTKFCVLLIMGALVVQACNHKEGMNVDNWSDEEITIIEGETPLYVLSVDNSTDETILRSKSVNISNKELLSDYYTTLCQKMIATVCDPSQDGVGIAGPQIGILRRIVAVQRLDKPEEPFEVYPNIRIVEKRGDLVLGSEGCLSVPNRRGEVARSQDIDIIYSVINDGEVRDTTETIQGFTAVIFQHECDHLDGILYIDYEEAQQSITIDN